MHSCSHSLLLFEVNANSMLNIHIYHCVMPTEMFLSCVGDLATFGGPVGRDLGPATP